MQSAMTHYAHLKFWVRRKPASRWTSRGSSDATGPSSTGQPAIYQALMAAFPDAKIVLNVRDPEAWYESTRETLWIIDQVLPWWFPRVMRQMHDEVIWQGRFQGEFLDRAKAIAVYRRISRRCVAACRPASAGIQRERGLGTVVCLPRQVGAGEGVVSTSRRSGVFQAVDSRPATRHVAGAGVGGRGAGVAWVHPALKDPVS